MPLNERVHNQHRNHRNKNLCGVEGFVRQLRELDQLFGTHGASDRYIQNHRRNRYIHLGIGRSGIRGDQHMLDEMRPLHKCNSHGFICTYLEAINPRIGPDEVIMPQYFCISNNATLSRRSGVKVVQYSFLQLTRLLIPLQANDIFYIWPGRKAQ